MTYVKIRFFYLQRRTQDVLLVKIRIFVKNVVKYRTKRRGDFLTIKCRIFIKKYVSLFAYVSAIKNMILQIWF